MAFCQEPPAPPNGNSNQTSQQQNEQGQPLRIQLSKKEMKKLIVKKVNPNYPDVARNARLVGKCGVRVLLTPQGEVAEVHLVYGHPFIAPAALNAVRKWKFRPYVLDGNAAEVEGEVEINVP
jgi:periplasmic protein TonB